jgi:acetyl-CoA synthetase
MSHTNITSVLAESRLFPPPAEFQSLAHIKTVSEYLRLWNFAKDHPEKFWAEQASSLLSWQRPWTKVLSWEPPKVQWFEGGLINASYNCVDRHVAEGRQDKPAIIWEGEPGDKRVLSYGELLREVCKFANVLKDIGITKGDVVTIYLPMVPELTIAMLACARIGAMHNVIFAGFSSAAITDRNNDAKAKAIITADGGFRRGLPLALKANVDESLAGSPTVKKVVVLQRTMQKITMLPGRDLWWHDAMAKSNEHCPAEPLDSEHPLFMLYTSGSTGKPKGILHTTAGYLLGTALSTRIIFDLKEDDIFWCTADIGWVTGHSYVVYGPLVNGATILMYEGAPNSPDWGRFWQIIEKYRVTKFYTAPTAIRAFIKNGSEWPDKYDLSSLRLLGTVGEPINPEAWMWYHRVIGKERCPIVDTWWQTETGSIMIAPLPGVTPTTPGSATVPFFGIVPDIVDKDGKSLPDNTGGYLVIQQPWPSMIRTIHGDEQRYRDVYWNHFPGIYFTGDGARRDERGYYWIMGRIDDVINVSGHRLSTMEIESALVSHGDVAEAAVVGKPDDLKGEAITCFVTLEGKKQGSEALSKALRDHVVKHIGALARPDEIRFTEALPKTRSGKIMRRLLRDIAAGKTQTQDMSTLEDHEILEKLRAD